MTTVIRFYFFLVRRFAGYSDSSISRTNFKVFRCLWFTPRLHGEQQTPCVLQQEVWGGFW